MPRGDLRCLGDLSVHDRARKLLGIEWDDILCHHSHFELD